MLIVEPHQVGGLIHTRPGYLARGPDDVRRRIRPASDGLQVVLREVVRLFGRHTVRMVQERGRVDEHGYVRPVGHGLADGLGGGKVPHFAVHGVVGLVEHDVRALAKDQTGVGEPLGYEVPDAARPLVHDAVAEDLPLVVGLVPRPVGQVLAAGVLLPAGPARLAVAHAVVDAVVVVLVHAGPVDEEAVEVVPAHDLVEDVEAAPLVPLARGADGHEPVGVGLPGAVGGDVQPVRVGLGDAALHLGEVHASEQAHVPGPRRVQGVCDEVAAGAVGEVRVSDLEVEVRGVVGQDAADALQPGRGPVLLDVVCHLVDVHVRVDFADVGLQHAKGLLPPFLCVMGSVSRPACRQES